MNKGTYCLLASLTLAAAMTASAPAQGANSADAHIKGVTAITRVYADGLKTAAVAIQYDKAIRASSLSPAAYTVKTDVAGQKITSVYTSTDGAYFTKTGASGPYVVLELSTDYIVPVHVRVPEVPRPPAAPGAAPAPPPAPATHPELPPNPEVLIKVGAISWEPAAHPSTLLPTGKGGSGKVVTVTQVGPITASDGTKIAAGSSPIGSGFIRNMTVDGFMKPDYRDPANGNVKYNIHFPRKYDPNKKYPLVVYLADQNDSGSTHADALILANSGDVWAERDEEARHEAIVVVPLAMNLLVDDKYVAVVGRGPGGPPPAQNGAAAAQPAPARTPTYPYLATLGLMDYLLQNVPSIDKNRMYVTGQGDGARAAIKMMIDRPELFAAALLFAPDYDPAQMAKLSKANLWIVAAEEDSASYPNVEKCLESLKAAGARIGKAEWNGQAGAKVFTSEVGSMTKLNNNIRFSVLKKGTVVPAGVTDDAVNVHAYTWRIGYSIQALRDWLFTQKK